MTEEKLYQKLFSTPFGHLGDHRPLGFGETCSIFACRATFEQCGRRSAGHVRPSAHATRSSLRPGGHHPFTRRAQTSR